MKLCECGCGQPTPLAPQALKRNGMKKGEPFRYVQGHGRWAQREEPTAKGYWTVRDEAGKTKSQHLFLAEHALGYPLPRGAEVHHVDDDRRNNAPGNLVICQDSAYHKLLHVRARIVRAGGNPNTQKFCRGCDRLLPLSEFYPTKFIKTGISSRCKQCQNTWARKARKERLCHAS